MSQAPLSVHLILLAGQICFAALPVVGRLAVGHVPPAVIVVVRMTGGAIVFALIAWRRGTLTLQRGDLPAIVLCALLGTVINQEMFIHGLARSTATNAVVIGSTIPVFTAITAIALGREPIHVRRIAGMAIAFAGVAALVGAEELSLSSDHLIGNVLVLINAVSYGAYLVIVRPLAARYDPFALLAFMFLIGIPVVTPIGAFAYVDAPAFVAEDYAFLGFLIAIPTVAAYGLVQTALKRTESSLVAAYIYLQPVFAAIGAMIVLDEEVGLRTAICGVIVLFGVWLAARSRP